MAIFDRFLSKETTGQKRKSFLPTPGRRVYSDLDTSVAEAKAQYPDDSKIVEDFMWALKGAYRTRRKEALGGFMNPMRAEARFYLSKDRLLAYACMFPPENGGEDLTLEDFLEDMHYEGIVYGILEETIPQNFEQGYFHVFPVARGTPSQDGEDGKVIELFQRRGHMRLEVQNGSEVDFGQESQLQPIRRGTVICQILPPKEGADGMDVAGVAIPGQPAVSASVPQGKNLLLAKDGSALTAGVDGILYIENDQFCIHEQKIIDGDLDHFQGTLQVSGNLYIGGNVDGGASIVATGDIVINGKVGQARVTSTEGIIRVQQGIYGTEGKTVLAAASQIQSPVVEGAEVSAGTSVITEAISNSVIRCGSTVYAMTGRGLIVNSQIRAGESILCLRIGNLTGGRSRFSVGYPPEIPETWERIRAELAEAQSVIERLWEPIINLRRKGSRISDGEKALLARLVEQRELYVKKLEDLKVELREVNKALDKKSKGKIRCEKLFPILDVQIGRLTEEIITIEEKCNIHVEENSLRMT